MEASSLPASNVSIGDPAPLPQAATGRHRLPDILALNLLKSMKNHENLKKSMKIHEKSMEIVKIHENPKKSMEINGNP